MGADSAPLRRIRTETDLAAGAAALGRAVPRFAPVLAALGPLRLRRRPEGYATLVHAIVSQQVSVASASAIWARLEAAGLTTPAAIAGAAEADLIAVGLTRAKQRYVRALALSGIDYPALGHMPPEAAIKRLTQQPGIGRWTAE
ncbi:MAG: DNA-3-methyladenine glycosylase 2 family protein, partial [Pseudomonadota bacterium]